MGATFSATATWLREALRRIWWVQSSRQASTLSSTLVVLLQALRRASAKERRVRLQDKLSTALVACTTAAVMRQVGDLWSFCNQPACHWEQRIKPLPLLLAYLEPKVMGGLSDAHRISLSFSRRPTCRSCGSSQRACACAFASPRRRACEPNPGEPVHHLKPEEGCILIVKRPSL